MNSSVCVPGILALQGNSKVMKITTVLQIGLFCQRKRPNIPKTVPIACQQTHKEILFTHYTILWLTKIKGSPHKVHYRKNILGVDLSHTEILSVNTCPYPHKLLSWSSSSSSGMSHKFANVVYSCFNFYNNGAGFPNLIGQKMCWWICRMAQLRQECWLQGILMCSL